MPDMLHAHADSQPIAAWGRTPWMPFALAELGQREIFGAKDNPRIQAYYAAVVGAKGRRLKDEVPWCAAFVGWALRQAGLPNTGSLAARSYLRWGVEAVAPFPGCVVVFSRPPNPASGHVAFWMGAEGKSVLVLGGNQGDRVCVKPYPAARVLAYRQAVA